MTKTFSNHKPPADDQETTWPEDDFTPPAPRPRRRLLTPLTGALAAVLLVALGFIGGVEVQKHSGGSASTGAPAAARGFPSFAGGQGGPPAGFSPGGGAGGNATQGTVSYVKHGVIYLKDSDGNTLKVKVSTGTDVTRTAKTAAAKVHPGDTIVVQGKTSGATITATSVTATANSD
jgi:hypothetical protein